MCPGCRRVRGVAGGAPATTLGALEPETVRGIDERRAVIGGIVLPVEASSPMDMHPRPCTRR